MATKYTIQVGLQFHTFEIEPDGDHQMILVSQDGDMLMGVDLMDKEVTVGDWPDDEEWRVIHTWVRGHSSRTVETA